MFNLKDARQQTVWHGGGVAVPVLAVFVTAAVLVAYAAMHQQDGHVDDVKVRQQVHAATGHAVRQRAHQVARVVHVAGHPPEGRCHQFAFVKAAVGRSVGTLDESGLFTPDFAVAFCATEKVFLMVRCTEDVVSQQTQDEDACSVRCG